MIGVLAGEHHVPVVKEFFELFKTPWEPYRDGARYDVILDCLGHCSDAQAKLTLICSSKPTAFDQRAKTPIQTRVPTTLLSWNGCPLPIYCGCLTFRADPPISLIDETRREPVIWIRETGGFTTMRFGFNVFDEVGFLLQEGQPPANAATPTLDFHIALIREAIVGNGLGLIEIPPVPAGHSFTVCLTHDADHPSMRRHKWDGTILGFLSRALVGSLVRLAKGRITLRQLGKNWKTSIALPWIQAGVSADPWDTFAQYLQIERGLGSTFYIIPQANHPGQAIDGGRAPAARAAAYGPSDIAPQLGQVSVAGSEIGLHGIDAWKDPSSGIEERNQLARVSGHPVSGVRMHWLYSDARTPVILDQSGFNYDSSFGYNDTVGFRGGTTQIFKPLGCGHLLEVPLHIMDTAMFFPSHLNLGTAQAGALVSSIMDHFQAFGGTLTINWHDRSIAPERLWGDFYLRLLDQLNQMNPWFPTVAQAVAWARHRRSASFGLEEWLPGSVRFAVAAEPAHGLPGMLLRIYKPFGTDRNRVKPADSTRQFIDFHFTNNTDTTITC